MGTQIFGMPLSRSTLPIFTIMYIPPNADIAADFSLLTILYRTQLMQAMKVRQNMAR